MAHGFASLTDMAITYLVDGYYNPADELGWRDDPEIGADWGLTDPILSARDQSSRAVRTSSRCGSPQLAADVSVAAGREARCTTVR